MDMREFEPKNQKLNNDVKYSLTEGVMEFQDRLDDFGLDLPLAAEGYHQLEWHSNAGEDMVIDFEITHPCSLNELCDEISSQLEAFDVNEHVSLWAESAGRNGVPDVVTLVDDAREQKRVLEALAEDLRDICRHTENVNDQIEILQSNDGIFIVHDKSDMSLSFYNNNPSGKVLDNIEVNGEMYNLELKYGEEYNCQNVENVDVSNLEIKYPYDFTLDNIEKESQALNLSLE